VTGVQGKPRPASESRGRVSSLAPGSGPRRSIIFSGEMEGNEERGSPINWDSGNRGGSPPGPGRHVTRLTPLADALHNASSGIIRGSGSPWLRCHSGVLRPVHEVQQWKMDWMRGVTASHGSDNP
jgi:phage terminase large subunit-like protein